MTAYSHILTAPGTAGDRFTVDHYEGARFSAPFTALVWHPTEPKDFVTVAVSATDGDDLLFTPPDTEELIQPGMRIATKADIDIYAFGDPVTLDGNLTLAHVSGPQGDDFYGSTPYTFIPEDEGLYTFRFEEEAGSAGHSPDDYFFVLYSDVSD